MQTNGCHQQYLSLAYAACFPLQHGARRADYFEYFGPDYQLHPNTATAIENLNAREYLEQVRMHTEENLRKLQGAPGVMMQEVSNQRA